MSMNTQLSTRLSSVRAPWSSTLKPAVRRVADWKKALSSFCPGPIAPSVAGLAFSATRKKTVPPSSRTAVMDKTSLV